MAFSDGFARGYGMVADARARRQAQENTDRAFKENTKRWNTENTRAQEVHDREKLVRTRQDSAMAYQWLTDQTMQQYADPKTGKFNGTAFLNDPVLQRGWAKLINDSPEMRADIANVPEGSNYKVESFQGFADDGNGGVMGIVNVRDPDGSTRIAPITFDRKAVKEGGKISGASFEQVDNYIRGKVQTTGLVNTLSDAQNASSMQNVTGAGAQGVGAPPAAQTAPPGPQYGIAAAGGAGAPATQEAFGTPPPPDEQPTADENGVQTFGLRAQAPIAATPFEAAPPPAEPPPPLSLRDQQVAKDNAPGGAASFSGVGDDIAGAAKAVSGAIKRGVDNVKEFHAERRLENALDLESANGAQERRTPDADTYLKGAEGFTKKHPEQAQELLDHYRPSLEAEREKVQGELAQLESDLRDKYKAGGSDELYYKPWLDNNHKKATARLAELNGALNPERAAELKAEATAVKAGPAASNNKELRDKELAKLGDSTDPELTAAGAGVAAAPTNGAKVGKGVLMDAMRLYRAKLITQAEFSSIAQGNGLGTNSQIYQVGKKILSINKGTNAVTVLHDEDANRDKGTMTPEQAAAYDKNYSANISLINGHYTGKESRRPVEFIENMEKYAGFRVGDVPKEGLAYWLLAQDKVDQGYGKNIGEYKYPVETDIARKEILETSAANPELTHIKTNADFGNMTNKDILGLKADLIEQVGLKGGTPPGEAPSPGQPPRATNEGSAEVSLGNQTRPATNMKVVSERPTIHVNGKATESPTDNKNFVSSAGFTLSKSIEGGDTVDNGGRTRFGISQNAYPKEDIANLTEARALELYHRDYWEKPGLDKVVDERVATAMFDWSVNSGPGTAVRMMQQVLGFTGKDLDGRLGPKTLAAINKAGSEALMTAYIARREKFYRALIKKDPEQYAVSERGWMSRLDQLRAHVGLVKSA